MLLKIGMWRSNIDYFLTNNTIMLESKNYYSEYNANYYSINQILETESLT